MRVVLVVAAALALAGCSVEPAPTDTLDNAGAEACEQAVYLTSGELTSKDDVTRQREKVEALVAGSGYVEFHKDGKPFILDILRVCKDEGYNVR